MATRRWLKIGAGVAGGVTTIVGLFVLLSLNFGFVITDLTGDIICEGSYASPCISEFEVRNPTSANVDIYSKDQVKLDFSPEIKDWALFVPDGRCSATGKCACDVENGKRIGFEDWRCVDFTNKTKPREDKVYNFRFPRYSTTKFRLAGIKDNPREDIKWGFGAEEEYLDPTWEGIDIGYRYLDDAGDKVNESEATVVHIWNQWDDYYFNKSSGIQFSNYFEDYWTRNIFCAGYKDGGGIWRYDCTDALPFNWNLNTDNLTYVNYTGWRDKTIGSKTVRLGIRYSLKPDQKDLNIELSVENIGAENITNDLGFAWRIKEISINNTSGDDFIKINGTNYDLGDSLNLTFNNLENPEFRLFDEDFFVKLRWNENLNDWVTVKSVLGLVNGTTIPIGNAPVTLAINAGTLNAGQQKTTKMYWRDPPIDDEHDMVIYRGSPSSQPSQRLHNTTGWIAETTETTDVSHAVEWVKTARHPTSNELIACFKDSGNDIHCEVWDGSTWGNAVILSTSSASNDPSFDVCYEQSSGTGMVFYVDIDVDSSDVLYATWTGSWNADNLLQDTTPGLPKTIRCASDLGSDYIGVLSKDDDDDLWGMIWDGSSVDTATELDIDASLIDGLQTFAGKWETQGHQFIVAYYADGDHAIDGSVFTKGGSFVKENDIITGVTTGENVLVQMARDPDSDDILLLVVDQDEELEFNRWTGSSWGTPSQLDGTNPGTIGEGNQYMGVAYEGTGTDAIVVYGQSVVNIEYQTWDGSSWTDQGGPPNAPGSMDWIHLDSDPNSDNIMFTMVSTTTLVGGIEWNGTAWESAWTTHDLQGDDLFWTASFEYDNEDEAGDDVFPTFTSLEEVPANGSVWASGQVWEFNVTVADTNGSVGLEFNGVNYTATNLTASEYNVSITGLTDGVFSYYWWGFGNGSLNNYNTTTTQSYTIERLYGSLDVNMTYPPDDTDITQGEIFRMNITVDCSGDTGANCGTVYANLEYNKTTATPDTLINDTEGASPFWFAGDGECNSNFGKNKQILIQENSGASLTDYQVRVDFNYDADMQNDFSDVRFYDETCTELNYWFEDYNNGTNASVWIKTASLTQSVNNTIFMLYNNETAVSTTSNFTATFKFESIWNNTIDMGPARILDSLDGYNGVSGLLDYGGDKLVAMPSFKRQSYSDNNAYANISYFNRTTGALITSYQSANTGSDATGRSFAIDADGYIYEVSENVFTVLQAHKFNETGNIEWTYICTGTSSNCEYSHNLHYWNSTSIFIGGYRGSGGGVSYSTIMLDDTGTEVWANIGLSVTGLGVSRDHVFDPITNRVYKAAHANADPETFRVDGFDLADGTDSYTDDTPHIYEDSATHAYLMIDDTLYMAIMYNFGDGSTRRIAMEKLNVTGSSGQELETLNISTVESDMNQENLFPAFNGNIIFLPYYDYSTDETVVAMIDTDNGVDGNMTLVAEYVSRSGDVNSKQQGKIDFTNGSLFMAYIEETTDQVNITYTRRDIYEHVDAEPTYAIQVEEVGGGSGGKNPFPFIETLEAGEQWNISAEINVTDSSGKYKIRGFFNSTEGNANVPDNQTINATVCIGGCAAAGDTTDPVVSLIAPIDSATVDAATQSFNATATDNINVSIMGFYLWNSTNDLINQTNTSTSGTAVSVNLTIDLPYEDIFEWNYLAFDNATAPNSAFAASNFTLTFSTVTDTCTPPGSGVWDLLCSDNCSYTTEQQVPGNVSITGSGNVTFFSGGIWNFTNPDSYVFINKSTNMCEIFTYSGGGWNL